MKYYIQRGLNEYGPYLLADLQRYVAQGNISMSDLTRSEGMTEWVPVSQVIGNIPVPVPTPVAPAAGSQVYAGTPAAAPAYGGATAAGAAGPMPPDFHWALVLLITLLCGVFRIIWLFIEAGFVKKIKPESSFLGFLILGKCIQVASIIVIYAVIGVQAASGRSEPPVVELLFTPLLWLVGFAVLYVGIFRMRDAIQEYYNTVEPINLRLSGVMTFFFPTFYFQHHFSRIANWKRTGYLEPQQ